MSLTPHVASELANKYHLPARLVENLAIEEAALMARGATIKNFLPIFVARRVEERLRSGSYPVFSDKSPAA